MEDSKDEISVASLEEQVERLRAQIAAKDAEHLRLRSAVVTAAMKGKREHGWCNEIENIIDDLGLDWSEGKVPRQRADFRINLGFTSEPEDSNETTSWWASSLVITETESPNGNGAAWLVYLDEDHNDVRTDDFSKDPDDVAIGDASDDE